MRESDHPEEAPEITPQVLHLRDLLKWVRQGRVRVPNFQRDFTWDRTRMLNLFDSIRKQYPIGTLLFWESTTPRPMLDRLGPLQLPEFAGGKYLVFDGQQRLTTLAGVLLLDELAHSPVDDRDPDRWIIYYDAADGVDGAFTYFDDDPKPPASAVKVADLMATKGILLAGQRIMALTEPDIAMRSQWVERIEMVSAAFAAYRVPLIVFATNSLRLVVESFTRLNRSGQPVGADEMFSALTYTHDGDQDTFRLAVHIDDILKEILALSFGRVDRVTVLRVVLLAAGLDPFRTEWDQLAEDKLKQATAKLPGAIAEARKGLLSAVEFLRSEGIPNTRLLPYSMQFVGLAAFFSGLHGSMTDEQKTLLRRWLWVSAFTEGFGGRNPSRILLQLKNLREVISKHPAPMTVDGIDLDAVAHPFPERCDQRSARVRTLLCVMLRNAVLKPDGSAIEPEHMAAKVLEQGPHALVRVCAKVLDRDKIPLGSSPANRVFDVQRKGQAKGWLLELSPEIRCAVLQSHHISDRAWDALNKGDHRAFVEERRTTLMALERSFMAEKGVVPPKEDRAGPSAIDIEDDVPLSDEDDLEQ